MKQYDTTRYDMILYEMKRTGKASERSKRNKACQKETKTEKFYLSKA